MPYGRELKGIKLLQDRADSITAAQTEIASDIEELKRALMSLDGAEDAVQSGEYADLKRRAGDDVNRATTIARTDIDMIYAEAELRYVEPVGLSDILSIADFGEGEKRVSRHVRDFNQRYGLDGWDYAISVSCGLFAAMLDLLCVKAPLKPSAQWTRRVDGIFNRAVQKSFNSILPPQLSKTLGKGNPIGAPDSSTILQLIGAPPRSINPTNHRLHSLAHDPVLGFIFGVLDMLHGTCTTVADGKILCFPGKVGPTEGTIFQLLGRMLGHLLSDVNAPSGRGNRGMGLPAPFMGLLRMLEGVPVGKSDFGKQIEYMYVNGYDFRQFIVTSIPVTIMEVLLRAFYVGKQMKMYNAPFGRTMLDTMPLHLNPRFRIMLALAYGTSSAVNAGKMYITSNILNANYASWMGLAWNGLHALKWALFSKHLRLWGELEDKEIAQLEGLVVAMDELEARAGRLPT